MLELAILGLLVDQELHGYELKKRVGELLGPWSSVSFGSLYPALARFERAGLVATIDVDADSGAEVPMSGSLGAEVAAYRARLRPAGGRRGRKVYAVTESGRVRLAELLATPSGDERAFAVRVAFCRHLSPQQRLEVFRSRRSEVTAALAGATPADQRSDVYRRSLREFQNDRLQREQAWIDQLIDGELSRTDDEEVPLQGGIPT